MDIDDDTESDIRIGRLRMLCDLKPVMDRGVDLTSEINQLMDALDRRDPEKVRQLYEMLADHHDLVIATYRQFVTRFIDEDLAANARREGRLI